jgi:16S rRNA (cytosine967-C5)-methyltransferase
VARWLAREGFESVERWCRFNNASPDVTIRPLPGVSVDSCRGRLAAAGIETTPGLFVPDALRLPPGALGLIPEDVRRDVIIQDEGAQIVALAVGATPGECVLDACAAPGGKTLMLCDRVGAHGRVIAGDHRAARVALLQATLVRAGETVAARTHALAIDATAPLAFAPVFDRVLLDAPCSGLGTLRRDPDLKWTRTAEDFTRLTATQRLMIAHAADAVRSGGSLVYATCSSEPEENDAVVDAFLATRRDFTLEPVTFDPGMSTLSTLVDARGLLRTIPPRDRLDAFFAARLVRQQTA